MLAHLDDPIAAWQYAERYLGEGTRTYSRYAAQLEISPRFHPQLGPRGFAVPTFWVDPPHGAYLTGRTGSTLHEHYRRGDRFLLPVHPEALTVAAVRDQLAGCRPGPLIDVVPSANARTVFVERIADRPVPPHFLKLHYPKRLSRFTRRLRRPVIELQLWVADELAELAAPVLPEVGGGVIGEDPAEAWGFLLREARPRCGPELPYLVPLFALYGRDRHAPAAPTLLEQLIDHSGEDPAEWVAHRLIEPMISLWVRVLLATGCAIELHGQNTLLCLSADLRTTAIAYRDCAIYVDPAIRAAAGLAGDLPPRNVISQDVPMPREQVFSLVYDSFLGHHTLGYLAALLHRRWGVDPAGLHRVAKQVFAAQMAVAPGDPGSRAGHPSGPAAPLLPPTVWYYDDLLRPDGQWRLVDTGATPEWR